ncbi:unnamed protein product, partial [Protopolystoma xenopodis]
MLVLSSVGSQIVASKQLCRAPRSIYAGLTLAVIRRICEQNVRVRLERRVKRLIVSKFVIIGTIKNLLIMNACNVIECNAPNEATPFLFPTQSSNNLQASLYARVRVPYQKRVSGNLLHQSPHSSVRETYPLAGNKCFLDSHRLGTSISIDNLSPSSQSLTTVPAAVLTGVGGVYENRTSRGLARVSGWPDQLRIRKGPKGGKSCDMASDDLDLARLARPVYSGPKQCRRQGARQPCLQKSVDEGPASPRTAFTATAAGDLGTRTGRSCRLLAGRRAYSPDQPDSGRRDLVPALAGTQARRATVGPAWPTRSPGETIAPGLRLGLDLDFELLQPHHHTLHGANSI